MHRIAIRREDRSTERRAPLTPQSVQQLTAAGVPITVQPSSRRIFADADYTGAGAQVKEDLSRCEVIFGVKEVPLEALQPKTTYLYFSHTIKGQAHNMKMLRRLLKLKCTLIDYETIVDDAGRRLVFFGLQAGQAGMIDSLWAVGQRLLQQHRLQTPLSDLRQAFGYDDLSQASEAISAAGKALFAQGLPPQLTPLVFGFTGYGNVSRGAQQIVDLLDPITITPETIDTIDPAERGRCYKVVFKEQHLAQRRDGGAFELQHYYGRPEDYDGVFAERYLDRLTLLINCIYWEPRFPRLVTLDHLRALHADGTPRLQLIGDISCDVDGAIEATVKATSSDAPVFVYDVEHGRAIDGVLGAGPVVLAVDNLPAELPMDASRSFSTLLSPFVEAICQARLDAGSLSDCGLPAELERAVVVYRGELTPDYAYIRQYLD